MRTSGGVQVDIVLEDRAGRIVGIEVKASDTVTAQDFKGLRYLEQELKDNFIKGIVLYTGSEVIPFGSNSGSAYTRIVVLILFNAKNFDIFN